MHRATHALRGMVAHVRTAAPRTTASSSRRVSTALSPTRRAASLTIGDEVLAGRVQDANTVMLATLLHRRGVDLVRGELVPDVSETVVDSLRRLQEVVGPDGYVITSGGIGPTHDDITYAAVADATGRTLQVHEPTREQMKVHYEGQGKELNAARLRMATLPTPCQVHSTPGLWVPLVQVDNVFVLPGIPRLFQSMLEANQELFTGTGFTTQTWWTQWGEGDLADALTQVAEKYSGVVQIGSYPRTKSDHTYVTKLVFEGRDADAVRAAVEEASETIELHRPEG
eukprot:scaffold616_cov306-Pavlova_lutheri.AAC.9